MLSLWSGYDIDGVSLRINKRQTPQRTSVQNDGIRVHQLFFLYFTFVVVLFLVFSLVVWFFFFEESSEIKQDYALK